MKKKISSKTSNPRKKAKAKNSTARAKTRKTRTRRPELAESIYMSSAIDPAHSPGHRKMNLKENSRTPRKGSQSQVTKAEQVQRTSATNRRIITGAAVGKTGQIVFK